MDSHQMFLLHAWFIFLVIFQCFPGLVEHCFDAKNLVVNLFSQCENSVSAGNGLIVLGDVFIDLIWVLEVLSDMLSAASPSIVGQKTQDSHNQFGELTENEIENSNVAQDSCWSFV